MALACGLRLSDEAVLVVHLQVPVEVNRVPLTMAVVPGREHMPLGHLVPLAFLAPDIVARILSGNQPVDLTTEVLTKRIDLPLAWAEQRELLGFG